MSIYTKKEIFLILFIALAYFISAKIVSHLSLSQTSSVFVLWPPTGIALASLILFGNRMWLGIFIGAFTLNYSITPFLISLEIATTNTLGPLIGFLLINKLIPNYKIFDSYKTLFIFLSSIILASFITSFFGTLFLLQHNIITSNIYFKVFFSWFSGDLIGFIILTPLLVTFLKIEKFNLSINGILELAIVSSLLFFFLWLIFKNSNFSNSNTYSLEILLILPLLWFTIRFSTLGTTVSLLILSLVITIETINNNGPFVSNNVDTSLFLLQNFILICSFTFFIILVMLNANDKNSKKLEILTKKLLKTQKIAKIANWEYHIINNTFLLSKECLKLLNLENNSLTLNDMKRFVSNDDFEKINDYILNIDTKKDGLIFKFNSSIWINFHGVKRFNKNLIIGTIQDITFQKELEIDNLTKERIYSQQAKMASMGEMIENIAHQLRQPLSLISTSASGIILQKELNILTDEHLIEYLEKINYTSKYLSTTIDDFRNFFDTEKEKTTFKIEKILEKVSRIIYIQKGNNNINLIKNIEDIEITSYENELIQVIINILNNAKDALDERNQDLKLIFIDSYKEGNVITIKIKDNAGGVNEDIIDKVFEPYFTTKSKSNGTGIGLYMSHQIINKNLKGKLSVENVNYKYNQIDCKGASFNITLYDN